MGILDDAIREHLELKRRHGAASEDLDRLEKEAFGPPSRPGDPEFQTGEEALPQPRDDEGGGPARGGEPDSSEQPTTVAPRAESAPGPGPEEERSQEPAGLREGSAPEAGAEAPPEEPAPPEAPPEAPEHAIFDVEDFEDEDDDDFPGQAAGVHEAVDAGAAPPSEPRPPEPEPPAPAETEADDSGSRQEEPEESRPPAAEAPHDETADDAGGTPRAEPSATEERPATAPGEAAAAESEPRRVPDLFEDDEDAPPAPIEHRRRETGEWEDAAAAQDEQREDGDEGDDGEGSGGDEDLLEETPDFLRDAPEGERLWFEQGSPRDFDFDDD